MSPDEFARLLRRVLELKGNDTRAKDYRRKDEVGSAGPVVRRVELGPVRIEVFASGLAQVSIHRRRKEPDWNSRYLWEADLNYLTVFAVNRNGTFSFREEYGDAVEELQRLIILDALAEA